MNSVKNFLFCETPGEWVDYAKAHQQILLIDHANCEKKAAATALNIIFRYIDKSELMLKMSKLAREELRHFEKVCQFLQQRKFGYHYLSPSRYAGELNKFIRTYEPMKLVDTLIVGAIIEARSCERFEKLCQVLDPDLNDFYQGLLRSEARHFADYLQLAKKFSTEDLGSRIEIFLQKEAELILNPDPEFRFHSGLPVTQPPVLLENFSNDSPLH